MYLPTLLIFVHYLDIPCWSEHKTMYLSQYVFLKKTIYLNNENYIQPIIIPLTVCDISFIQTFILLPHSVCRSSESTYPLTIWTTVQYPSIFNNAKIHIQNRKNNKTRQNFTHLNVTYLSVRIFDRRYVRFSECSFYKTKNKGTFPHTARTKNNNAIIITLLRHYLFLQIFPKTTNQFRCNELQLKKCYL